MLYERLLGKNDAGIEVAGPIGVEFFHALLTEVARGELTGAEALSCIADVTTLPLDAGEVSEAQTLLQSVNALPSATAKLARVEEVANVLTLAKRFCPGYDRPSVVKTRLGG